MMRPAQVADRLQPVLVLAGRTVLGLLLAFVFSVLGIGVAWSMFVFFGAVSHTTLLFLFMSGAGIGATLGSLLAWLKLDRPPPWAVWLLMVLALLAAGTGGGWIGFQFGSNQEVECCVGSSIGPITYTALGSTAGATGAALVMYVGQAIKSRRGWPGFRPRGGNSAPNGARRLPPLDSSLPSP